MNNLIYRYSFIGMAAISVLLESAIFYFTLEQTLSSQWFLFAHAMVVIPLVLFVCFWEQADNETYFSILLVLSVTILGVLGALCVLGLYLFHLGIPQNSNTPTPDLYETLLSELRITEQDDLFEQLISGNVEKFDQNSVIPFMDVLHYGSQREKQSLIALLINNYQGKYSSVIKEAVKDKDNSIRVLASMGIAQLENQFMNRTLEIEAIKSNSDASEEKYLKTLGQNYDEYAYCGILDEYLQADFRNLAIKAYKKYLRLNPLDGDVLFWLCRALMRNGKTAEAAKVFEVARKYNLLSPKIYIWYLESLYRLQEYEILRKAVRGYSHMMEKAEEVIPYELNEIIQVWSLSGK